MDNLTNCNITENTATAGATKSVISRIHSSESRRTVDDPGIRSITFFQGCLMRCLYYHSRDTWGTRDDKEVTVEDLMKEMVTYHYFMNASDGDVTVSGGEAILQAELIRDWFRACRKGGIRAYLNTNGFVRRYDPVVDELLKVTDLMMLDFRQANDEIHQNPVGVSSHRTLEFVKYLMSKSVKVWIRYVVVPGWSNDDDSAHRLGEFTRDIGNVKKIELLPYHRLGKHRWVTMGKEYKLDGVKPPRKETVERVKGILKQYGHKVIFQFPRKAATLLSCRSFMRRKAECEIVSSHSV